MDAAPVLGIDQINHLINCIIREDRNTRRLQIRHHLSQHEHFGLTDFVSQFMPSQQLTYNIVRGCADNHQPFTLNTWLRVKVSL